MLTWNEDPKTRTSSKIRTLVLIQETKKGGFCHYLIKSMGSSRDIGWNFVESFGKFGGLIISWKGEPVDLEVLKGGYMSTFLTHCKCMKPIWITNDYGYYKERRFLWSELLSLSHYISDPRCLGGVLNIMR